VFDCWLAGIGREVEAFDLVLLAGAEDEEALGTRRGTGGIFEEGVS